MLIARGGYNPGGAVHGQQITIGMNAPAARTFRSIEEKIEIVEQAQLCTVVDGGNWAIPFCCR